MRFAFLKQLLLLPLLPLICGVSASHADASQGEDSFLQSGKEAQESQASGVPSKLCSLRLYGSSKANPSKKEDKEEEHRSFFLIEEDDDDKVKHRLKLAPRREPLKGLHPSVKDPEKGSPKAHPPKTSSHRWHLIIEVLRN